GKAARPAVQQGHGEGGECGEQEEAHQRLQGKAALADNSRMLDELTALAAELEAGGRGKLRSMMTSS
ncbi:MAG: hypothetical protein J0H75_09165, partial [Rhizobiales bacterium]|nr:hypothetical protein [Hyphomicrobiales bacterium]